MTLSPRQYYEDKAAKAWDDLGRPKADPAPKNPTQNDSEYDAFRHAYIQAYLTKRYGEDLARAAGDKVERDNKRNHTTEKGQRDMRGDLKNNEKGREIAKDAPEGSTDKDLAQQVEDALDQGDLIVDKQTDPETLKENFPDDLNPTKEFSDVPGDIVDRFLDDLKQDMLDAWENFTDGISDALKDLWDRAKNWWPRGDPIILDLDGNGLETVGLASNVYFDHDSDGVLTKSGWAGSGDAFLVWDRNANSNIDNGSELFGDFTPMPNGMLAPNGFAALAALDGNGDGIIDASDPAFAELKLWKDTNIDGKTGGGELITLAEAGIASLNINSTLKNQTLSNGNTLAREGSFTRTDGSTSGIGEFNLAIDTFHTQFAEEVVVPDAVRELPNMGGAGNVRDLQQAAAQSSSLQNVLTQFSNATTREAQKALLDSVLLKWADSSGMAESLEERADGKYRIQYDAIGGVSRSANISAPTVTMISSGGGGSSGSGNSALSDIGSQYLSESYRNLITEWSNKLHVLEAFNGQYFFNLPAQKSQTRGASLGMWTSAGSGGGSGISAAINAMPTLHINLFQQQLDPLNQAYASLKESVYGALVIQTRLKPYLDAIELKLDDNDNIYIDASVLNQMLADKLTNNTETGLGDLLELDRYAGNILSATNWSGLTDFDHLIETLPQTENIAALLDEFKIQRLGADDETTYLGSGNDIVLAGEGGDVLYGNNGNDRLFGQDGDDLLSGGNGDDLLSGGAGNDELYGSSGADTYVFGRGFGYDTIIDYAENGVQRDTVRLLGLMPADIQVTEGLSNFISITIRDTGETLNVSKYSWWNQTQSVGRYVMYRMYGMPRAHGCAGAAFDDSAGNDLFFVGARPAVTNVVYLDSGLRRNDDMEAA